MGIVNKIFTSVSGLYSTLNPITLGGVNDIIVVKHPDGSLRCSPFQLRFTKLQFYNLKSQTVHLYINGIITEINMTITSNGDLFFEQDKAIENPDIDKIIDFIQSSELDINAILETRLGNVDWKISEDELKEIRSRNLERRIFGKIRQKSLRNSLYNELSIKYMKISTLLSSPEHLSYLIERKNDILSIFCNFIYNIHKKGVPSSSFSFSSCLNGKVEKTIDETFDTYLVKTLNDHDSVVVRIEGSKGNLTRFYMPYVLFCKIYFELKSSKNKNKRLIEMLENEYNNALGWNIFGNKQQLKRDISFSLILNSGELSSLNLKFGCNKAVFKIGGQNKQLEANMYLWEAQDKIVVSDIDGTITKSDIRGHFYSMVGRDWTHNGVAALFSRIVKNGYKILYLTARPLGQSSATRNYLKGVYQDSTRLPDGPVILNPDSLFWAIYREVIIRKPEEFKIQCLKTIKDLFEPYNPFVAGFGNRITDVRTYIAMSIPKNKIYTINPKGDLHAEYSKSLVGTYHTMNEFIDSIFPNLYKESLEEDNSNFNDFSWWK